MSKYMNLCWFLVGLPGSDAHPWIGPDNGLAQCPSGTRKSLLVPSWSCSELGLKRKFNSLQKWLSHFRENFLGKYTKRKKCTNADFSLSLLQKGKTCQQLVKKEKFPWEFLLFLTVRKKCVRRELMRTAALKNLLARSCYLAIRLSEHGEPPGPNQLPGPIQLTGQIQLPALSSYLGISSNLTYQLYGHLRMCSCQLPGCV
jgi:hypothetical protein